MTTSRTHQCNFCRGVIKPGDGIGLYWEGEKLVPKNINDAENHLCRLCRKALEAFLHYHFKPIA